MDQVQGGWAGLLASIGLLVSSLAELLVSGYSCLILTPKLCGCLRTNNNEELFCDGRLKTRNMVHQWVTAQSHVPKSQPIYVVQPMLPMHPMIQVSPDPVPPPFYSLTTRTLDPCCTGGSERLVTRELESSKRNSSVLRAISVPTF